MKLDRTNQLLLGTVLVLGLLAGLRLLDDLRPAEALWSVDPFDPAAIQSILWATPSGTLALERADSRWMMTAPIERPADPDVIGTFARDWYEGFTPDLRLDPRPSAESLAAVELDEAHRSELILRGPDGDLAHLVMGKKIGGGSHYLQRPGDKSLYRGRVPGSFRLNTDPDAWRDARLVPFAKDDLAEIVIEGGHGRFVFRRLETPDRAYWEGVEPAGFAPSSRALDQMGRSLGNLKAKRVLEGDEALAAAVTDPAVVVIATTEAGASYTIRFGAPDDAAETVHASIDGDDRAFLVASSVLGQFDKSAKELRDKTVIGFRRPDAPTITWIQEGRTVVVVPDGDRDWAVQSPADFAPEESQLQLAANSLLNLQAAEVVDAPVELSPGGPRVEIATADASRVLLLAPAPDDQGRHLAQIEGGTATYVLRGAVIERLMATFAGTAATP